MAYHHKATNEAHAFPAPGFKPRYCLSSLAGCIQYKSRYGFASWGRESGNGILREIWGRLRQEMWCTHHDSIPGAEGACYRPPLHPCARLHLSERVAQHRELSAILAPVETWLDFFFPLGGADGPLERSKNYTLAGRPRAMGMRIRLLVARLSLMNEPSYHAYWYKMSRESSHDSPPLPITLSPSFASSLFTVFLFLPSYIFNTRYEDA